MGGGRVRAAGTFAYRDRDEIDVKQPWIDHLCLSLSAKRRAAAQFPMPTWDSSLLTVAIPEASQVGIVLDHPGRQYNLFD